MPNLQLSSKCTVLKSPAGPARPGCTVPCLRIAPSSMHTLPTTILQAGGSMTLPCLHDAEVVCAAKADVRSLLLLLRRLRPAANHTGRAGLDEVACNTRDGSASVASQSVHLELTATARSTAWCRRRLLNGPGARTCRECFDRANRRSEDRARNTTAFWVCMLGDTAILHSRSLCRPELGSHV